MTAFEPSAHDPIAIDTLRFLAVDMVEAANSGHPGAPMGQAALAYLLWTRHLAVDPEHPEWLNRDRFVLSCGHASALLYGLLHLSGFDLPMAELERFRQLGSKTPGHPEHGLTPGVDTTTGPLGQGISNAVGMAMAQRLLAEQFNRDGFPLFDHRVFVLASDGDLMEGVASEAASLAGHLQLGSLNVFYDANEITIDGPADLAFTEDAGRRFEAYGWHVQRVDDGNDLEALDAATRAALDDDRPSLVVVRTHIGFGSPNKQDTAKAHGAPLGADEVKLTKENLGWPLEPTFHVPDEARQAFAVVGERGGRAFAEWSELRERYAREHEDDAAELDRREERALPDGWHQALPDFEPADGPLATRKASGAVLNAVQERLPELFGGSADLTGSNNTWLDDEPVFTARGAGRNVFFGVREHGMAAALNGMALSGLVRPYGGTFLVFSDYMRPSIRLAALMEQPTVFVFTHDSIFLGEDGPTHQPEAHLAALRAMPNVRVIRPADANETAAAWRLALEHTDGPTALVLTRQKLPILEATRGRFEDVARGGYVLRDADGEGSLDGVLLATGSEVSLALAAQEALADQGRRVRVVSLPCWELFAEQPADHRYGVLPPQLHRRLALEAAASFGWERWVGEKGDVLGVDRFGASAPYQDLAEEYGFTVENVVERYLAID